jgi:hypothetical protein
MLSIFGNVGSLYNWATDHKSIIVGGSIYRSVQRIGTSIYVPSCLVCFKCFLNSWCLLYQLQVFSKTKVYKIGSCYSVCKAKRKVDFLWKLSQFYITETLVIYYWSGELILSPIRMWLPPQPYKWCSFGCRYTLGGRWSCSVVFGILRLKPIVTVVNGLDNGVLSFGIYCIWLVTYVSRILL